MAPVSFFDQRRSGSYPEINKQINLLARFSGCAKDTEMKLLKAIVRPNKLEEVKDALTALNVTGMTVTEVRGHGRQKGHKAVYRGTEYSVTLLPKIMIELVIQDEMVDDTIKTIIETARTGEIGDGRVFVLPIEQGYNIRTGERDVV